MVGWWRPCLIVLGVLAGCASVNPRSDPNSVVISNLRVGTVCSPASDLEICQETNNIIISGKQRCIYDGNAVPCTWYGFSFDYRTTAESFKLRCFWSSSEATNIGNPNAVLSRNVRQGDYELDLNGSDLHFFNPQYSVFETATKDVRQDTYCVYNGKKVIEFFFVFHYVGNSTSG